MRLATSAVLVLLVIPAAARAQDFLEPYVNERFGFRVDRPDAHWRFEERAGQGGAISIVLTRSDDQVKAQLVVEVERAPVGAEAGALRDQVLAAIAQDPKYSSVARTKGAFDGVDAPGLSARAQGADGVAYRVEQSYVVREGVRFVFRTTTTADGHDAVAPVVAKVWAGFSFVPLSDEARAELEIRRLAERCGRDLPWADDWAAAARRARSEKRLVLVNARFLTAFELTDGSVAGPFTDPEVAEVLRERFVLLKFGPGMAAPFTAAEVYGLSGHTFGHSFLVVDPDGRVLDDVFALDEGTLLPFLLETLAAHPEHAGPRGVLPADRLERAAYHVRRGELDRAGAAIEGLDTAAAHRLRAGIASRHRRGEAALGEIARARAADDGTLAAELDLDEAVLSIRRGRIEAARAILRRAVERADSPRRAEATWWLGACEVRLLGAAAGSRRWKELLASDPESPWAHRAAATMLGTGFSLGIGASMEWPDETIRASIRDRRSEPLPATRAARARDDALAYLLSTQREDGSWISPTEVSRASSDRSNEFTEATTALAGLAIVTRLDDPRVAAAVAKAREYLVACHRASKGRPAAAWFMDYRVWQQALVLLFLARSVQAGSGDAGELRPVMGDLVEGLAARQRGSGGWSYYLSTRIGGPPVDQSISFTTATVLIALATARGAGVPVADAVLARGAAVLERMRNPDGSFEYMIGPGEPGPRTPVRPEGAAGRAPVCMLALALLGRATAADVERALDLFVAHRAGLDRERDKSLVHTGPHAQGSHYVLFDYAFAGVAVRNLPADRRARHSQAILDGLLAGRREDGSYRDNPRQGFACGTALALLALRSLEPDR